MTLIVSLRTPDGIVIAGDSLSTITSSNPSQNLVADVICPQCNHNHQIQHSVQVPALPITTFPYAQKVLPFCQQFGVGIFGTSLFAGKSIYFAMRMIEQHFVKNKVSFGGVTEVAQKIGNEVYRFCIQQLELQGRSIDTLSAVQYILGLHVVGYDDTVSKAIEVFIRSNGVEHKESVGLGCTYSGVGNVVHGIWGLYADNSQSPPFDVFSLQDAIDYSEFLIQTTITHQRFSQTIPNVGGDIDIALITPFNGF